MVSIVTVTYNAEKTLERTLMSVEAQTYTGIQHIIMDGGSKDGTVKVAEDYKRRVGERYEVIVVSERDNGLYDAMNKALNIARGEFVCFLNAGDKLHAEDTLADVARVAVGNDVGVIYGDTDIVDDKGKRLRSRRLSPPECLTWRSFREGMLVCHQSFYVNRSIAQKYDLGYKFSADFDWCIRSMRAGEAKGMRNVYIRKPLTDYLSEGMTTANHKASLKERFRIMANHYGLVNTIIKHIWFIIRALIKK